MDAFHRSLNAWRSTIFPWLWSASLSTWSNQVRKLLLNEELEPLGLRVSWVKTKIQAFNDILDAVILSVPVYGEDVEVMERFTCLGSDIHVSAGCEPEVNRCLSRAWGVMDSLDHGVWHCWNLCRRTKVQVQVPDASSLALWM